MVLSWLQPKGGYCVEANLNMGSSEQNLNRSGLLEPRTQSCADRGYGITLRAPAVPWFMRFQVQAFQR